MTHPFSEFLSERFNRVLVLVLLATGLLILLLPAAQPLNEPQNAGYAAEATDQNAVVEFFYMQGCPHCTAQHAFNQGLQKEFPSVQWRYHDVGTEDGAQLFAWFIENQGI